MLLLIADNNVDDAIYVLLMKVITIRIMHKGKFMANVTIRRTIIMVFVMRLNRVGILVMI